MLLSTVCALGLPRAARSPFILRSEPGQSLASYEAEGGDERNLPWETLKKVEFLGVLNFVEKLSRANGDDEEGDELKKGNRRAFLMLVERLRGAVRALPDGASPTRAAFQPLIDELLELARARGGAKEEEIRLVQSMFDEIIENRHIINPGSFLPAWGSWFSYYAAESSSIEINR